MTVGSEEVQESVWQTMVDVLRVTEKDKMSSLTANDSYMIRMEQVGEAALRILDRAWDGMLMLALFFLVLKCYLMSLRFAFSFGYTCAGCALVSPAHTT